MKSIKRLWNDIRKGKNLDIYITIFTAFAIAISGAFHIVDEVIVFSAILATLALLSISLLANRHSNENLEQLIAKLKNSNDSANILLKQNFDRAVLKPLIKNDATQLIFWVVNATKTIPLIKDDIEHALQRGLNAQFLFAEPQSAATKMNAFRSKDQNFDEANTVLQLNLSILTKIAKKKHSGKVEIRTVDYLQPYNIIAIDPDKSTGRMFIRFLTFGVSSDERPYFELTTQNDKDWFQFFEKQFKLVWNEAKPYEY